MAAALSTLQQYRVAVDTESKAQDQRSAERPLVVGLTRSRQSRRRYRVIASARRLTALFETSAGRGGRVQAAMS